MKIIASALTIASLLGYTSAFTSHARSNSAPALRMADIPVETAVDTMKEWPKVNGWVADPSKFCAGLPGSTAPLGEFDPLGLTADMSIKEIKRYRESEVTHGRVAMLATVGYLVGESFHPLFGGAVTGPANSHLEQVQEIAPAFFIILVNCIAAAEIGRALIGWKSAKSLAEVSDDLNSAFGASLLDTYYPGDIGFDPLALKPKTDEGFKNMATKELQNGRLAMFAASGMLVQEQITHEPILQTLKSYF